MLMACRGDPVSFLTTEGEWIALLNQVWGLQGCHSFLALRMAR